MINRRFWLNKINDAWGRRSLVWLSGVRRTGKTTLCKLLPETKYLNCDLPSVRRQLDDPEFFFKNLPGNEMVVFDEIQMLENPSSVLKIGVDEFPGIKILATGSSTTAAIQKFSDSLTGRKINLLLTPVPWNECINEFNINDLDRRLLNGGLPAFLLMDTRENDLYSEWIDSYYARDIFELFRVRNRTGFLKLLNLLMLRSGGMLEITSLAKESGLTRPTVMSHIESMEIAHTIYIVRPFYGGGKKEIVKRPKVYAFDTGFVCYAQGWNEIRQSDRGILWEHLVLDMLRISYGNVFFWNDKYGNEVDFILKGIKNEVHTIECKINPDKYASAALHKFREYYPEGKNYCYSPHISKPYKLRFGNYEVIFQSYPDEK